MACQQFINHVAASANYLASLPAENQAAAVTGQLAAVKIYIAKLSGPQEALQAAQAIQDHYKPYLNCVQMADLVGMLNDAACKLPVMPANAAAN